MLQQISFHKKADFFTGLDKTIRESRARSNTDGT
jgi:hypothetical protein